MDLLETRRERGGATRCYADGRRIGRDRMDEIKRASRLDTFTTELRAGRVRQRCVASAR